MPLAGSRKNKPSRVDGTTPVLEHRASRPVSPPSATRRDIRVTPPGGTGRCGPSTGGDDQTTPQQEGSSHHIQQ